MVGFCFSLALTSIFTLFDFLFLFSEAELPWQIHFGLHLQEKYFCFCKLSLSLNVSHPKRVVSLALFGFMKCWVLPLNVKFHFFVISRCFCVDNLKSDRKCQLLLYACQTVVNAAEQVLRITFRSRQTLVILVLFCL